MKALQNGPGSNDAPFLCGRSQCSGKFLAKLVPLKEDSQQVNDATCARE